MGSMVLLDLMGGVALLLSGLHTVNAPEMLVSPRTVTAWLPLGVAF